MNLSRSMDDLRFVIGIFLTIIGLVVLGTYLLGSGDSAQGIHVNLLGGALLSLTGIGMIVSSLLGGDEA